MPVFSATHLKVGDPAPDFTLDDQSGKPVKLSSLKGKRVVLYFYPKADTPSCTAEACSFRDQGAKLPADVVVLGVSKDSVEAERKFAEKYKLTFPLLGDRDGEVIKSYGVDTLFGIAKRKTFLIDSKGKIAKIIDKVDSRNHAEEVNEALRDVS